MTATERLHRRQRDDHRMDRPHRWRVQRPDASVRVRIAQAERKARYGHRDWLQWTDRAGKVQLAVKTAASLKQALLDTGTQYAFTVIFANDATRQIVTWPIGLCMLRNAKYGC